MGQELLQIGLVAAISVIVFSLVVLGLGFRNIHNNITKLKTKSKEKHALVISLKSGIITILSFITVATILNMQESPLTPMASMLKFQINEVNPLILYVGFIAMLVCTLSASKEDYNRIIFGNVGLLMTSCYFYISIGLAYIAMYFKY